MTTVILGVVVFVLVVDDVRGEDTLHFRQSPCLYLIGERERNAAQF